MLSKCDPTVCSTSFQKTPHPHAFHPCAYACWCLCKQFMALKITSSSEWMFCIAEPKWKQVNCENCLQDTCALKHIGYTLGKLKDFSANPPSVEGLLMKCWGKVWYLRWNLWMGKMKSKNLGRRQLTCYSEGQLKLSYISFPCPKGKKTVKISQFWLSLPTHRKDYLSCGPSQPVLQKWVYSVLHFPLSIFSIGFHKNKKKKKQQILISVHRILLQLPERFQICDVKFWLKANMSVDVNLRHMFMFVLLGSLSFSCIPKVTEATTGVEKHFHLLPLVLF